MFPDKNTVYTPYLYDPMANPIHVPGILGNTDNMHTGTQATWAFCLPFSFLRSCYIACVRQLYRITACVKSPLACDNLMLSGA